MQKGRQSKYVMMNAPSASPQSYSVVIEGITDNGKLIHAVRQVKGGK